MKKYIVLIFFVFSAISCGSSINRNNSNNNKNLEGRWILNYITGPRIAFNGLYPDKKPFINFDLAQERVSGNSSCNSFTGKLVLEGNKVDFSKGIAMTNMACIDGKGEQVFMNILEKVTSFEVSKDGKTLTFKTENIDVMRFSKE